MIDVFAVPAAAVEVVDIDFIVFGQAELLEQRGIVGHVELGPQPNPLLAEDLWILIVLKRPSVVIQYIDSNTHGPPETEPDLPLEH
jgi:hypothetical protein